MIDHCEREKEHDIDMSNSTQMFINTRIWIRRNIYSVTTYIASPSVSNQAGISPSREFPVRYLVNFSTLN